MANELPYFRLYAAELLADENTGEMTPEELGALLRLWCRAWVNGSIPADAAGAMRAARLPPDRTEVWEAIKSRFVPDPKDPSRLISPRLEAERSAASKAMGQKIQAGRAGGKASGEARRKQRSSTACEAGEAAAKPFLPSYLPANPPTEEKAASRPARAPNAAQESWDAAHPVAARLLSALKAHGLTLSQPAQAHVTESIERDAEALSVPIAAKVVAEAHEVEPNPSLGWYWRALHTAASGVARAGLSAAPSAPLPSPDPAWLAAHPGAAERWLELEAEVRSKSKPAELAQQLEAALWMLQSQYPEAA